MSKEAKSFGRHRHKIEFLQASAWPAELDFVSNSFGPRRLQPDKLHLWLLMSYEL